MLEGRPTIGGGCKTAEVCLPGFKEDLCSTKHGGFRNNPLLRDNELNIRDYGYGEWTEPDPVMHIPFLDGASITVWHGLDRTYESIAKVSKKDADTFRRLVPEYKTYTETPPGEACCTGPHRGSRAVPIRAQQRTQVARQEVPDNLAPHPAPMQPVPYSHKTHLAIGLQCQRCHTNPEPGNLMTFPASTTCMNCHAVIDKDKPAIMKLAALAKPNQPVPWVRIYQLTPGVTWSHRKHLQASMACGMCQGDVAQLDAMAQTTSVTSMASCIGCHASNKAQTTCIACHAWPSD